MQDMNLKNVDPRMVARAAEYIGSQVPAATMHPAPLAVPTRPVAPMVAPVGMPGAPTPGGYMRYREMTIDEMLLENRVVFLVGEINHISASNVIMRLLYLQSVKRDQDINLYINSPGGVVDDTLAIYDIMRFMTCDVATYCIGRAESGGAIVFMAGKKGKRFILPNAKVMIHQPFGGVYGQAADIEIQADEILKTKDTLLQIMSKCTGQPSDRIREDSERDRFFDAKQAVAYGICDEILGEDTSAATAVAASDATKPK
ncbi:MAG: ClpP family protease [Bacillota bacterium]